MSHTNLSFQPKSNPFEPGLLSRIKEPIKKIVALKASRIGDFINTTPAFRAIKKAYPQAELSVITLPMLADIAVRNPWIDRYLPFPGYPGLAEQLFDPLQTLQFLQQMQAEQFDLAIQIQGTGVYSNPFTLMLAARYTAGFIRSGDPAGRLDSAIPWPQQGHEIQRSLSLIQHLGIPSDGVKTDFYLNQQDQAGAFNLVQGCARPWIGLHPMARDPSRRWPTPRFIETARELQRQQGGTILLFGEENDRSELEAHFQGSGLSYLNLAGQTSIATSGALFRLLNVLITNDSGPAHIAYSLDVPTIVLFGAGDPLRNGPLKDGPFHIIAHPVPCRPCEYHLCPIGLPCLESVSAREVSDIALRLMERRIT